LNGDDRPFSFNSRGSQHETFAPCGLDADGHCGGQRRVDGFRAAQRLRTRLYEEARATFARVDLLALPATPVAAPGVDEMLVRLGGQDLDVAQAITRLTAPFNLLGLPALALPCGFTSSGMPVGLQLVGPAFAEDRVLAAGHAYQRATDWHRRRPLLAEG